MPNVNSDLLIFLQTVGVALIGLFQFYNSKKVDKTNEVVNQQAIKGDADRAAIEETVIMSGQKLDRLHDSIVKLEVEMEQLNIKLSKFVK